MAMTFPTHRPLPWQASIWSQLTPALTAGRLGHALLFTGPPGIGKRHLAGALAHALLCDAPASDGNACGSCRSCVQLGAGSHPDFSALGPAEPGRPIRVEQVRGFTHRLQLTAQNKAGRVGLIAPADGLTATAANALLKTLEEPTAGTHILLIAERPRAVLATIRSRCQLLRLARPSPPALADWLAQAPPAVARALPLARGAPLRAMALAEADAPADIQAWLQALQQLLSGRLDAVMLAGDWHKADPAVLLDWLFLVTMDLLKLTAGAGGQQLTLEAHAQTLAAVAESVDRHRLRRLPPRLIEARRWLDSNADKLLILEWLCINLAACRGSDNP